jgi:hypothetical protein
MELRRNDSARYAKAWLYQALNDFDVFVEDTAEHSRKLYAVLIGRVVGATKKLKTVFPIGGRDAVIERCVNDNNANGRPRVYIVDGDLHVAAGNASPDLPRLFVLPVYCIENILVDFSSIEGLCDEESIAYDAEEVADFLDLSGWLNESGEALRDLFVAFAAAFLGGVGVPLVARGAKCVAIGESGLACRNKVKVVIDEIRNSYDAKLGIGKFETEFQRLMTLAKHNNSFVTDCVSGKDFLLPLLFARIRARIKIRADNRVLQLRLARTCDVSKLMGVAERVGA